MAFVTVKEMMGKGRKEGYAIGAFTIWSLESAQAVLTAAKNTGTDVILMAGSNEEAFAGSFDAITKLAQIAHQQIGGNAALHLDHATRYEDVCRAIDSGFSSVMIDASALPFDENVALTCKVVEKAHPYGIAVEAELGRLVGSEGITSSVEEAYTVPAEAEKFVALTGVDSLAVSIGTAHGFYKFPPKLNIQRLESIAELVSIPLVLHGGSGTPDEMVKAAIRSGIAKVNICTEFIAAMGKRSAAVQQEAGFTYNVPNYYGRIREAGVGLVEQKIALFMNRQ